MMSKENLNQIKKITSEFFEKAGFETEIEVKEGENSIIHIDLSTNEPQILIGERGRTLAEIQRLLSVMLKRQIYSTGSEQSPFYIDVDIQDYKKKKKEYLKELAQSIADEVALSKEEKILPSMPAYERRIIHLELEGRNDVSSESIGEEPERKIIIKSNP